MFGTIIDYWTMTGDSSYNDNTIQAIVHQAAETRDFMPKNQTRTEGNDDQGFWAMTAMSAAENRFPDPPSDQPQYLALVQAVYNEYVQRWDEDDCNGGLRWQIFSFNNGYNYKNSISNGCFFNIAARLARYTGNTTYADWATKVYDWQVKTGLILDTYEVLDGITIDEDRQCRKIDKIQWTYNAGIYLQGAAALYNMTGNDTWKGRVDGILNSTQTKFLKEGVLYEQFCEPNKLCNNDQQSFKGYLARWLASTAKLAPHTEDKVMKILQPSGEAAAAACNGSPASGFSGHPGTACGFSWTPKGNFDGIASVGSQMNALSAVMYNLNKKAAAPVTSNSGGTSRGDVNAGPGRDADPTAMRPITTADRVGAGFVTVLFIAGAIGSTTFMMT